MTRVEYEALLERFRGAQANIETWTADVETARQELEASKANRDRYLKILHDNYELAAERHSAGSLEIAG
jgi:uncharacterized protein YlxW (UPF0749 family)